MKLIVDDGFDSRIATLRDLRQAAKEMGYVLVPVEPTEDILYAFWRGYNEPDRTMPFGYTKGSKHGYKLMIEAAQQQEVGDG